MSSAEEEQELTLIDHLIELRDRILKSVVAVVALFLALLLSRTTSTPTSPHLFSTRCPKDQL